MYICQVRLHQKTFYNCPYIHMNVWIHFCFTNSNKSPINLGDKYLKSLYDKFLTNESRLEFINFMLSIKTKLLLIVKAMSFSNPFGKTSNLPISYMIKWLS